MSDAQETPPNPERRRFLGAASSLAMAGGLVAGYGTFFTYAGRFLYPAKPGKTAWMFVTDLAGMKQGDSRRFQTPVGASVVVTRQGTGDTSADFLALSSTCPHLGCQVHWESQNSRFFCPCHNGAFAPDGKAIAGPPADAGQSLPRYPLKVDKGMLFIEVPIENVARRDTSGRDPCLGGGHAV